MNFSLLLPQPRQKNSIGRGKRMSGVHDNNHSCKGLAFLQVTANEKFPMALHLEWNAGVAVARKIDEESLGSKGKEIDQLCPSRCLAYEGKAPPTRQRVECARFSGVGSTYQGNFGQGRCRHLPWVVNRQRKNCAFKAHESPTRTCTASRGAHCGSKRRPYARMRGLRGFNRPAGVWQCDHSFMGQELSR
jgi:hypothetical protein